ncbi:hypothetical protein HB779_01025 (plasmid) [Phyllobacterium sp. 628]|uniref:hypothetical protein n=1 Tax=Phyllobacterium sp. 628 TaxID=2718938 RepID=UPI0016621F30|nr:hypothetical protein [Phyllobacterium sp. 628]QND50593.1 hypothetical protein HB779_01025 [Phyllobacterium sp. 628]
MTIAELHKIPLQALPKDVFSLSADAFVDAWASAFNLTATDLPVEERHNLAQAIRNGTNRMKIIDALRSASPDTNGKLDEFVAQVIRRPADQFALLENFTRFAPDDNVAFLRYSFSKICGREPSEKERLSFEFDLRRNVKTRADIVKQVVAIARRDGQFSLWDTLEENEKAMDGPADQSAAQTMPAGLAYNLNGQETLIFIREVPNSGWMIGPDLLRQPVNVVDSGWKVNPGWLMVGPKRSFQEGSWLVKIDLVQDHAAKIAVQLVANSGLDILLDFTIAGSFVGGLLADIRKEHRFVELRLRVIETADELHWVRLREVSMQRENPREAQT